MNRTVLPIIQTDSNPSSRVNNIAAAGGLAIPTLDNGDKPVFVFIQATGDTPGTAVCIGPTELAAPGSESTDFPVVVGASGFLLNVKGYGFIGYEEVGAPSNLDLYVTAIHNSSPFSAAVSFTPASTKRVTATTTGTHTSIPTLDNGDAPVYLMLQSVIGTGTLVGEAICVNPQNDTTAGDIATSIPLVIGTDPIILNVKGKANIGYELNTVAGTDAFLFMVPLDLQ